MNKYNDLFDILACPNCKVHVTRNGDRLKCESCGRSYPIVNGIPVLFPDGSVPVIQHQSELLVRKEYDPWVHRIIFQSLLDDQIVLDIGSGSMAIDDPCIIRMDVTLSPYVDLVADAHYLPLLPESVDYIFSLAVFEHLYNPFQAAKSIYDTLKDGGFIYHECNFLYAYHGYPHHYFNATMQGMERVFADFVPLMKGVAPYQMPSFALDNIISNYLTHSQADQYPHGRRLTAELRKILSQGLMQYDLYFTQEAALNIAAGTYFSGFKQTTPESTLVPPVLVDLWKKSPELQRKFPNLNNLVTAENILIWTRTNGADQYPEVRKYVDGIQPFNKRGLKAPWNRDVIKALPFVTPVFTAIGADASNPIGVNAQIAEEKLLAAQPNVQPAPPALPQSLPEALPARGMAILRQDGLIGFSRRAMAYLFRKLSGK